MLVLITLPFYDFCGFRSVAVNSFYKLQFLTFILKRLDDAMDVQKIGGSCHWRNVKLGGCML